MSRISTQSLLSLAAILGLAAPLPAAESGPQFRLATFRCDVTPPVDGHPLIWVTPVKTVEEPLLAKGVVLDDGAGRYVLCAVDWCGLCNSTHRLFRTKIADAAGTDAARVAVQTVHQHTAPYTDGDAQKLLDRETDPPRYADFRFLEAVTDRLAEAVRESLGRLQPFDRVGAGRAKVERVASIRRIPIGDGKIRGRMSSAKDPELWALPEGDIDPLLRTVTFARGDRPLVRLHYYATHPQTFYGDPRASSDMPGFARERLEKKENVFQIYFTGCSGDVAMGKYNDGSPRACDELTERLYRGMEAAVADTRFAPVESLAWRAVPLALPARSDPGHTVDECRAKMADPKQSAIARIRAATQVAYAQRDREPLDLSSLHVGRVFLLNLPGECMVEFQHFAVKTRPREFVAVAAYGDLGAGYVCTEQSFAEGGYEPSASHVAPKSESALKEAIRTLLAAE